LKIKNQKCPKCGIFPAITTFGGTLHSKSRRKIKINQTEVLKMKGSNYRVFAELVHGENSANNVGNGMASARSAMGLSGFSNSSPGAPAGFMMRSKDPERPFWRVVVGLGNECFFRTLKEAQAFCNQKGIHIVARENPNTDYSDEQQEGVDEIVRNLRLRN
jgi:hypothetical protein